MTTKNQNRSDEPVSGVHAWLILWKAFRAVENHAVRSIEALDICISDFGVLEILLHKGPMPINKIAKKVLLTSGSITALVDRLEKRNLVERFDDADDRRIRMVRLTATGRSLIKKAFVQHEKDLDQAVSTLDSKELDQLVHLLRKVGLGAESMLASAKGE